MPANINPVSLIVDSTRNPSYLSIRLNYYYIGKPGIL